MYPVFFRTFIVAYVPSVFLNSSCLRTLPQDKLTESESEKGALRLYLDLLENVSPSSTHIDNAFSHFVWAVRISQ